MPSGSLKMTPALDKAKAEIDRLRAELAEAKLERDTALTDRYDTIQDLRAELVAKDARIAELEATVDEIAALASNGAAQRDEAEVRAEKAEARVVELEALCKAQHGAVARAERAEAEALKAKAHIAALCDAMVYSDSYGVQGSDFQCCHACSAGGAPKMSPLSTMSIVQSGKPKLALPRWWDDHKAAEEESPRARRGGAGCYAERACRSSGLLK